MRKVLISALSSKDEEGSNSGVTQNRQSRQRPNEGVPDQINLTMIFDPAARMERTDDCLSRRSAKRERE